jgi:hypothetical protein
MFLPVVQKGGPPRKRRAPSLEYYSKWHIPVRGSVTYFAVSPGTYGMAANVKVFGCRPLTDGAARMGGRRRKTSKGDAMGWAAARVLHPSALM